MSAEQGRPIPPPAGENPKIRVRGRIGQAPQFRSVPDQKTPGQDLLVGNFSIAEHPDRESTVWHEVATFGDRSRRLQKQFDAGDLKVGQEVEVEGTVHRRDRPTKDGGTRIVEQIYAYSVKAVVSEPQNGGNSGDAGDKADKAGPTELPPPDWH
jgi:single-stranded DNA-binding protein